jgi:hypothetical protein
MYTSYTYEHSLCVWLGSIEAYFTLALLARNSTISVLKSILLYLKFSRLVDLEKLRLATRKEEQKVINQLTIG